MHLALPDGVLSQSQRVLGLVIIDLVVDKEVGGVGHG